MNCEHQNISEHDQHKHCNYCGVFIPKTMNLPISDPYYVTTIEVSPFQLFQDMKETYSNTKCKRKNEQYLIYRKNLIEWIFNVTKRLGLSLRTAHVASFYTDIVLNDKEYPTSKFQVIGLSCLVLASKYSELDIQIPFLQDYLRICRFSLDSLAIKECESLLLKLLKWNLRISTMYEMVMNFLTAGVTFSNDKNLKGKVNSKDAILVNYYAKLFTEFAICSDEFLNYDFDLIACTIVYLARKASGILNEWCDELIELTGTNLIDMNQCIEWAQKTWYTLLNNNEIISSLICDSQKPKKDKDIYEFIFGKYNKPIERKPIMFNKKVKEDSFKFKKSPALYKQNEFKIKNEKTLSQYTNVELLEARSMKKSEFQIASF